jgi:hypothetical protein
VRGTFDATWNAPAIGIGDIVLWEVGGNLDGTVTCNNIGAVFTKPKLGIYVRGECRAPIVAKDSMVLANIVAQNFTQPIRIGRLLTGSVVAVAPQGRIPSLVAGRDLPNGGMEGVDYPPSDMSPLNGIDWYNPPIPSGAAQGGTTDAVIRADSIGTIDLANMDHRSTYPPRVEARVIDDLTIGRMARGVIWSGALEYAPDGAAVQNDPTNDYASIGVGRVDCMASTASLWYKDAESLTILDSMRGVISVPTLERTQTLVIGNALGIEATDPQCTECVAWGTSCPRFISVAQEDSPRSVSLSERGLVRVAQPAALAGNIILDAAFALDPAAAVPGAQPRADRWQGDVVIGASLPVGDPNRLVLNTDATTLPALRGPRYLTPNATLGGGSIGMVPFALHAGSTRVLNREGSIVPADWVSSSDMSGPGSCPTPRGYTLDFYGPVTNAPINQPALQVTRVGPPDGFRNKLRIIGNPGAIGVNPAGTYRVDDGQFGVLVHDGLGAFSPVGGLGVPIADAVSLPPASHFDVFVRADCEAPFCIAENTVVGTCYNPCFADPIDFNRDAVFPDQRDVLDFLTVFSGSACPAAECNDIDFNNDGVFPDQQDVVAFFDAFGGGSGC